MGLIACAYDAMIGLCHLSSWILEALRNQFFRSTAAICWIFGMAPDDNSDR
jgi:hypothetical protein